MGPDECTYAGDDTPDHVMPDRSPDSRALATVSAIHVADARLGIASIGLAVAPREGRAFRAACVQSVPPDRCELHLGAVVPVHVHRDRAVRIDWPGEEGTWRPLPGLLVDGVHDLEGHRARRRLPRGQRALATVLGQSAPGPAGPDGAVDVEIEVGAGRSEHLIRLMRRDAPFYARHLLRAGAILPAIVDEVDGTVLIDWLAAANGLVARHLPPPGAVLTALATGGFGATSADAPGLRRPMLRPPGPDGTTSQM